MPDWSHSVAKACAAFGFSRGNVPLRSEEIYMNPVLFDEAEYCTISGCDYSRLAWCPCMRRSEARSRLRPGTEKITAVPSIRLCRGQEEHDAWTAVRCNRCPCCTPMSLYFLLLVATAILVWLHSRTPRL